MKILKSNVPTPAKIKETIFFFIGVLILTFISCKKEQLKRFEIREKSIVSSLGLMKNSTRREGIGNLNQSENRVYLNEGGPCYANFGFLVVWNGAENSAEETAAFWESLEEVLQMYSVTPDGIEIGCSTCFGYSNAMDILAQAWGGARSKVPYMPPYPDIMEITNLYISCVPPPIEPPTEPAPTEAINLVQDSCIRNAVQTAINSKSTISALFEDFFNPDSLEFTVTFRDVTNLPDTTIGTARGVNSYTFDIDLNVNVLPQKSQEYAVATVYHEVLHAHFMKLYTIDSVSGKWNISNSHGAMADDYIALLSGALRLDFPSLTLEEAWALSWGGLEKTNFYQTKLTTTERTNIQLIMNRHKKNATDRLGSYCRP